MMVFHLLRICMLLLDVFLLFAKSFCVVILASIQKFFPPKRKSIEGQVVLITGAAHGLGKQLALRFARRGGKVVLWDINKELNEQLASEINNSGKYARAYTVDVSDAKKVQQMAAKVRQEVGDVTILINNAAVAHILPLMKLSDEQIKTTISTNLLSHFWTTRQFLPRMEELGLGHIVAIASTAGLTGYSYFTDYCATKYGVVGFMATLQEELRAARHDSFIHLTTICPVAINTGLTSAKTRFPSIVPILEIDYAADRIVNAVLRNENFVVIPHQVHLILNIVRFFPVKIGQIVSDFLEFGADPQCDISTFQKTG